MATHFSLSELGVGAGDITPIGALDTNPPPGQPLQTIAQHLGPAPAVEPVAAAQRGWESIFKPGMGTP